MIGAALVRSLPLCDNPGMVLPRFSLRWIFLATTVFAVVSLVLAQAAQGEKWAVALTATFAAFALMMAMQAYAFYVAWLMRTGGWMMILYRWYLRSRGIYYNEEPPQSPFAAEAPVKQIVEPPLDPDL